MPNIKLFALRFANEANQSSSYGDINTIFYALTDVPYKHFQHPGLSGVRREAAYSWIMTIASSKLSEADKIEIYHHATDQLIIPPAHAALFKLLDPNIAPHKNGAAHYVNPQRIEQLRGITSQSFDLQKLIVLLEELNKASDNNMNFSIMFILRSVLDHIPPIFEQETFAAVASSYAGTRSFKEAMGRLESSSRKIADLHLHTQIRSKESVPNKTQVDFSNDLDLLLAEIDRLTRNKT